jgi:putative FmdB family regulatory protein
MPIFEYHCEQCEHDFELLSRAGEPPECPECHSVSLRKKWSTFAAQGGGKPIGASAVTGHAHGAGCGCCGGGAPGACGLN